MAVQFGGNAVNGIVFNGTSLIRMFFNNERVFPQGITSSTAYVTVDDNYVIINTVYGPDIPAWTLDYASTASMVKGFLAQPNSSLHIYNSSNVEIADSAIVGTGMTIKYIISGVTIETKTIVVKGDVDGDGYVTMNDYSLVQDHVSQTTPITDPAKLEAADVNDDGQITMTDATLIQDYWIGPSS